MVAERRLVLVRHAKAGYPYGVPDHERPLSGKGRRHARAAGRWFVTEGPRPGLVLCSDATRARHTWEIVRAELLLARRDAPVELEPDLYGAATAGVIERARRTPSGVSALVVVGHEPAMSGVVAALAGPPSHPDLLAAARAGFPTSGIAVLGIIGDWAELACGTAVLESFVKPRD
jgi:phosphohistidine phosphatase